MIIVDSNAVSELMRPRPEQKVIEWLDRQPRSLIWTTSVTVFEVRFGLEIMPKGKRRDAYRKGFRDLLERIENRVAPFDIEAAQHASDLMALRKRQGRPREARDTMIAGIVLAHHAIFATRNIRDFEDIPATLVDPWNANR